MGVITDSTGRLLVNAVGGIDTTGLMTDATGQDIVTAINNISSAISPAASNVTYENTSSGLSASNVQAAIDEVVSKFTPTITDHNIASDSPVSVANDTYVTIDDFILDKGVYLIVGTYIFAANATGYRYLAVTNSSTGTGGWYGMSNRLNAVTASNQTTTITVTGIVNVTSSTHIYVKTRQNSGSTLNLYGRIRPTKLA